MKDRLQSNIRRRSYFLLTYWKSCTTPIRQMETFLLEPSMCKALTRSNVLNLLMVILKFIQISN